MPSVAQITPQELFPDPPDISDGLTASDRAFLDGALLGCPDCFQGVISDILEEDLSEEDLRILWRSFSELDFVDPDSGQRDDVPMDSISQHRTLVDAFCDTARELTKYHAAADAMRYAMVKYAFEETRSAFVKDCLDYVGGIVVTCEDFCNSLRGTLHEVEAELRHLEATGASTGDTKIKVDSLVAYFQGLTQARVTTMRAAFDHIITNDNVNVRDVADFLFRDPVIDI